MQKVFVVKAKKQEVGEAMIVPFHPEFLFVKSLGDSSWEAKKDTESIVVSRIDKGNFYEYEVEKTTELA